MNKRWLITGTGSGLGRALAEAALKRGDRVAALQRGGEDIPGAATWRLDVRDQAALADAVHAAEAALGGIDLLVPNAGYGLVGGVEETSDAELREQFEVNFFSVMTLLRAALPAMRARRAGRILAISSVSGLVGWPSLGPYSASKFALEGALETLAQEAAPLGLRVTLIEPGGLRTDFATRSRRQSAQIIADYDSTIGQSRRLLADHAGHEAGNPAKAAAAILAVADHPDPPLRLLLGEDALLYVEAKLDRQRQEIERWRDLTLTVGPPNAFMAPFNKGLACQTEGNLTEAIAYYQQALALKPDFIDALCNLANALQAQGNPTGAIARYRQALAIRPDLPEVLCNLANVLKAQGSLTEAIQRYKQALAFNPKFPQAFYNFGLTLGAQGKFVDAIRRYGQALILKPDYPTALSNLGNALAALGRIDEAVARYERALVLEPSFPEALYNLGNARKNQRKSLAAIRHYEQAVQVRPRFPEALYNLGNVLNTEDRLEDAIARYRQALRIKPDSPDILYNLGNCLKAQGRVEDAIACYDRGLQRKPDDASLHCTLIFVHLYRPGISLTDILTASCRWNDQHAGRFKATWPGHRRDRQADRRPRIGFVSGDFRSHVVGTFVIPVIEALSRRGISVTCYHNSAAADAMTARFRRAAGTWRPILGLSDDHVATLIQADHIDILFDLSGYTAQNSLLAFARKPAPLQISWVGYPATTGLEAMDYLLADRHQIPDQVRDRYREKIVRLPDSYIGYAPPRDAPSVTPLPYRRNGFVTFGSFNEVFKIGPDTIDLWSRILHRLPSARLLLKATGFADAATRQRYALLFEERGIERERLDFIGRTSPADHMAAMSHTDIALDSFPYTGGATTLESLWMGLPVITMAGETLCSRHSLGYLSVIGMPSLIAPDPDRYVALAVGLAEDPMRLAALRAELRPRMAASPLCDVEKFADDFETACRTLWDRHLAGAEPQSFDVPGRLDHPS